MPTLQIDQQAPSFSLPNTDRKMIGTADYQGKNLLVLFFPLAFTGTCTTELCSIRDNIAFYNNINTPVVAISVDSPFVLAKFKAEQNLNFELLSDFNKQAAKDFGCLDENFLGLLHGVSKRSAFIIDKKGKIQYAEVLDNPGNLPNFEAIQAKLNNLG